MRRINSLSALRMRGRWNGESTLREGSVFVDDAGSQNANLEWNDLSIFDTALSAPEEFFQELVELCEDSLAVSANEEKLKQTEAKLREIQIRESNLEKELQQRKEEVGKLQNTVGQLQNELMEERAKAKEEAEDMAQEVAEVRYQFTEMLEEERQLRARTEKMSVHRVEELEALVRKARQGVQKAMARKREAEAQAEEKAKEIQKLQLLLQANANSNSTFDCAVPNIAVAEHDYREACPVHETSHEGQILSLEWKVEETEESRPTNASVDFGNSTVVDADADSINEIKSCMSTATESEGKDQEVESRSNKLEAAVKQAIKVIRERTNLEESILEADIGAVLLLEVGNMQQKLQEAYSEMRQLQSNVEEMKQRLAEENEQHVETLIRYEEERASLEAETESNNQSVSRELARLEDALAIKEKEMNIIRLELAESQRNVAKQNKLVVKLEARVHELDEKLQTEITLLSASDIKHKELTDSLDGALQKLASVEVDLKLSLNEGEQLRMMVQFTKTQLLKAVKENQSLSEKLRDAKKKLQEQEKLYELQEKDNSSKSEHLANRIPELENELLNLRQQLAYCGRHQSELENKASFLETVATSEREKSQKGQEINAQQADEIVQQEKKYFTLTSKFNALQNDFSSLEHKLTEARKKERDAQVELQRLRLEVQMAKEEMVNSEVRLQKALKHSKEQLDIEKRRFEEIINMHKQREWSLNYQLRQKQGLIHQRGLPSNS